MAVAVGYVPAVHTYKSQLWLWLAVVYMPAVHAYESQVWLWLAVGYVPAVHTYALGSIPRIHVQNGTMGTCDLSNEELETGGSRDMLGRPSLLGELQAS